MLAGVSTIALSSTVRDEDDVDVRDNPDSESYFEYLPCVRYHQKYYLI